MYFARFPLILRPVLELPDCTGLRIYHAEDGLEGCAYFEAPPSLSAHKDVSVVRLQRLQSVEGAAAGRDAQWHYIVSTDVRTEQEDDFNAWYEQEHLPGLAAVPGTVRASRHRVVEGAGARYHACYDLADRSAFNSPAWLAVRGTPWSSRVRPAFLNTRRTMFRRADPSGLPLQSFQTSTS